MKTIALINFSLEGHHLSFVRTFAKILLEQGNRVICLVPQPQKITEWIHEHADTHKNNLTGHEYNFQPRSRRAFGRFSDTIRVLDRWRYDAQLIKKVQRDHQVTVDLVFYAWVDSHLSGYLHPLVLNSFFPFKWSGLYFHPYHLRQEQIFINRKASWRDHDSVFLSKNCIGVALHDIGLLKKFKSRIGKPVIHFPETADSTPPDFNFWLSAEIKKRANGRIIIGMIGCEKHKGALTMLRMIKYADPSKYFFAFTGILPRSTYNTDEWDEINNAVVQKPENVFFHFDSIPEGSAYNAVFCEIDISFLVYDNFISSSNRLTKAAIFEKLVLASNNYCVGEDVKQFALGVAVEPKNPDAALNGLKKLTQLIEQKKFPYQQWKTYRDLNSVAKLFDRFKEITTLLN